ncbi:MAG: RNA methyltransferase [Patescibacteria group bacterium]
MKAISSLDNQIIKDAVWLKKASERKERGLILIDGAREIAAALEADWIIKTLFYCPELARAVNNFFGLTEDKIIEVSKKILEKISYKENPDGFLAVALAKDKELEKVKLSQKPLIVVLEAVEKPGNLGAIIRTAYAAGVDAIIINDSQTDIYNPNVIRASEGYIFKENLVMASREETIEWLKKNKIKTFAAATDGNEEYTKADLNGPMAIILGSEAEGLGQKWLKAADTRIKIPMRAGMDSLNVSVAAAVILFEAKRQRSLER